MLERFYPDEWQESTYQIPWEEWHQKGIRGVIFDIDNTLVPHGAPADQRAVELFERLHAMEMKTFLLSNNKEPRVASFAAQVNSPFLSKSGKPGRAGYRSAMQQMGTSRETTLFVGDQLFTDVYGANRCGIYGILVKPIHPKEEIQIVIKRFFERIVLRSYEKHGKKKTAR